MEPTNVNENAAELQEPAPEGLLTDADLEGSPAKKRKVRKQVCTLMCMIVDSHGPMHDKSESLSVRNRRESFHRTIRLKTGVGPFCKNMESPPVAPVPPKSLPRQLLGSFATLDCTH